MPSSLARGSIPNVLKRSTSQSFAFRPVDRSYSATEMGFSACGVTRSPCRVKGYLLVSGRSGQRKWLATYICVKGCGVIDNAVVPDCHVIRFPTSKVSAASTRSSPDSPPAACRVRLLCKAVLQEVQRHVAFRLRDVDETSHKARVDKNSLEACHGMNSDDRMDRLDWSAAWNGDNACT